jgi:glycosyltransferase involved in cell wall biosynthesis
MDVVSELLVAGLAGWDAPVHSVLPVELCPAMVRRVTRIPGVGWARVAGTADRVINRHWDYPRWLRAQAHRFDLFHIIDHSYAHLALALPVGRSIVSCHDIDAFAGVLAGSKRPSLVTRAMGRRLLDGLQAAACVVCGSEATRQALLANGLVPASKLVKVPYAVHPAYAFAADAWADAEAERLCGPTTPEAPGLLHVGSTIPRKRIDVLLRVVAQVRRRHPGACLWRVGGPFTAEQEDVVDELGLADHIVSVPFVERRVLAAVYRRAHLVLQPSEREGFGLPVIEAMACGTPVVASDIAALREAGGAAATYCRVADLDAWTAGVGALLDERVREPYHWTRRQQAAVRHAQHFSQAAHARAMAGVYRQVLPAAFAVPLALTECAM